MDENICITSYVLLYVKGFLLGKHHKSDCVHAPQHNSEEDLYMQRDASSLLPGLHQHQHNRLTEISEIVGLTILYALGWEHMCKILPVFYSSICCLFNPADFVGHFHVRFAYFFFNPSVEISVNMTCADIPGHPTKLHINKT